MSSTGNTPAAGTSGGDVLTEHVRDGVAALEPLRTQWCFAFCCCWLFAIGGIIALFSVCALFRGNDVVIGATAGTIVVAFLIAWYCSSSRRRALEAAFNTWREEGVRLIDAQASFDVHNGLARSHFDYSGLNSNYFNEYYCNSLLTVGDVSSSSITALHRYRERYYVTETYTDSQGHSQTRQVEKEREVVKTIYDGMMLIMPAELPHSTWLALRPKHAGLADRGMEHLRVACPELHNNYIIGSTDGFAGYRALTPGFMDDLWEFREPFAYLPSYSFRDDRLYITLPHYWLQFGRRPDPWRTVTTTSLDSILQSCRESIEFLKDTAKFLTPY